MDPHSPEQRLLLLESRHRRVVYGFSTVLAIILIALTVVGRIANQDPGPVTNLDRRVVRAILAAQYDEMHPIPAGSQDSPEARMQQTGWMDYEARAMARFEEKLAMQGVQAK